jgi:flagellar biosynthesis protein FlhA
MLGQTVVDAGTVLLTHLGEVIKQHAAEILSLQDVRTVLDHLRQQAPALVEETTRPGAMTVTEVHRILASLLRERVPIRDLPRILTTLAVHGPMVKDPDSLTELVRQSLARAITAQHCDDDGTLWVCAMDPALESEIVHRAQPGAAGEEWGVPRPGLVERLTRAVRRQMERMVALGHSPVVLCSPRVRPLLRGMLERSAPSVAVLSQAEIAPGTTVRSVGLVTIETGDEV